MPRDTELKRELGLFEVTFAGTGIILGAGIYALLGEGAALAGNAVWLAFLISAGIALFTGLSYAELSSMFPRASAEYEYTAQSFGRKIAFIVGWLIILSGVIASATVAVGFGGYVADLFSVSPIPSAILLIAALSLLLCIGVRESASVAVVFTLIEAGGLIFIAVVGIPYLGRVDYFEMPSGVDGLLQASALLFFAYLGFEEIVKMSEEAREPEKTIPRGLMLALLTSIVLYIAASISAVSVTGWQMLSATAAPFSVVAQVAVGDLGSVLLSAIALFATANTVLLMMYAASRIIYGMAESFSLPRVLARVHPVRRTPWVAILVIAVFTILFVFAGDIGFIANLTNYTLFVAFIAINGAVIVLRFTRPLMIRPFRVPLSVGAFPLVPLFGILSSILLLVQLDAVVLLIGVIITLIGAVIAFANIRYGRESP
ncbi:MAG: amino acid permease [Methanomicrobiales archaeon]|nr:amino acid permease [Methanomicrobiales archaeon]MDI6875394.1 amino acid permease [Methanomicrobiales archaeon]